MCFHGKEPSVFIKQGFLELEISINIVEEMEAKILFLNEEKFNKQTNNTNLWVSITF